MYVFDLLNKYTCVLVVSIHVSTCKYMYLGTAIPGHISVKDLVVRENFSPIPKPTYNNVLNA